MNSQKSDQSHSSLSESYTFQHPFPQSFSFPYPMIKYMPIDPISGKGWGKLIRTCKYFFLKNQIYPVQCLTAESHKNWVVDKECVNPKKISLKLWLHDSLYTHNMNTSFLLPVVSKCSLRILRLWMQQLTWNEYQFLTSCSSLDYFYIWENTVIRDNDGEIVTCDRLLENFGHIGIFEMNCNNNAELFKPDTVKNVVAILSRFKNMKRFELYCIPDTFGISPFTEFIMVKNKNIDIRLNYRHPIHGANKQYFEDLIDKIVANPPQKIPHICAANCVDSRYDEYLKLRRKNA